MLFKLGKTSHLVSTWTKETFWRLTVTILALFIFSCVLGHSSVGLHVCMYDIVCICARVYEQHVNQNMQMSMLKGDCIATVTAARDATLQPSLWT